MRFAMLALFYLACAGCSLSRFDKYNFAILFDSLFHEPIILHLHKASPHSGSVHGDRLGCCVRHKHHHVHAVEHSRAYRDSARGDVVTVRVFAHRAHQTIIVIRCNCALNVNKVTSDFVLLQSAPILSSRAKDLSKVFFYSLRSSSECPDGFWTG